MEDFLNGIFGGIFDQILASILARIIRPGEPGCWVRGTGCLLLVPAVFSILVLIAFLLHH